MNESESGNTAVRTHAHSREKSFSFFSHKYIKITATNVIIYGLLDLAVTKRGGGNSHFADMAGTSRVSRIIANKKWEKAVSADGNDDYCCDCLLPETIGQLSGDKL